MKKLVIMAGGFHPWHGGHTALYQSALSAFPDADVYVAATNDTSTRPFPFAIKEKLAQLAGVAAGHFVQVKSPFRAEEITQNYDPATTALIFVRSEKDRNKPPQSGGIKKDGSSAYLQPIGKKLEPMNKHGYMAYLPVVEFGPGMTSATQIRDAWPTLNEKRKTALVMSLYPATQTNPKLAETVVKMLDMAIDGGTQNKKPGMVESIVTARWHDQEGETFKNSLHTVIRVAAHLDKQLADEAKLPEWVSEKMGAVKDSMVDIMNYIISDQEMGSGPGADQTIGKQSVTESQLRSRDYLTEK